MAVIESVVTFTVRTGLASDLHVLVELDEYAQSHPERAASISAGVSNGECILAEAEGEVAGFVILNYSFFGFGFIPLIVVAASHRRRGVGLRLLSEAQLRCTSRKLFTSANGSNRAARALFARAGFVRSGIVENLDQDDPEIIFIKRSGVP
ncbi:MAG: GNAT family N-acetyltransferase [Betaproteobacteria bacterium]|nr:GNAT family N-acetyltransferase [Betaproteobacteria bacterium]